MGSLTALEELLLVGNPLYNEFKDKGETQQYRIEVSHTITLSIWLLLLVQPVLVTWPLSGATDCIHMEESDCIEWNGVKPPVMTVLTQGWPDCGLSYVNRAWARPRPQSIFSPFI